MRPWVLLLVGAALSAQAPPAELQRFDQALEAYRYDEAARIVDQLIDQRTPADGQPRRDPLLNALLGRLIAAGGEPRLAAEYLARAQPGELPAAVRAATALAHGRALESQGDSTAALRAYREAAAAGGTGEERSRSALGIARQLLLSDPVAARQQLLAVASAAPARMRWEVSYLLSLVSSLLGDSASAARYADEAWSEAANAPPPALAPLRVATLKAGLAAARRDLATERAMLAAANGLKLSATDKLGAALPVCGDDGIGPSDFVIFGIVAGPYDTHELVPIAASRMDVVAPFHSRLAGLQLIKEATGGAPVGTAVRVACRTSVAADIIARPLSDPLFDWFVERGLYPARAAYAAEDSNINAVAARVDALEARFGKQSILLVHPRWQLLTLLELRARAGAPVPPGQLNDLRREIAEGLRRAGAPAWLARIPDWQGKAHDLATGPAGSAEAMSRMEAHFRDQLQAVPFELGHMLLAAMLQNLDDDQLPAPAARLVLVLNERVPRTLGLRERQSWLLTVAHAQRSLGLEREAEATVASAGLERDLCAVADARPRLLEQRFTYEDYPRELIAGEQQGAVLFDFGVAASGSVTNPRIIYSLPSGLFDAPSAKGLASLRYTPAQKGGRAVPCRGIFQPVIWRIQEEDDFWTPTLTPPVRDETT